MDVVNKINITWGQVEKLVEKLAIEIELSNKEYKHIHGVQRGGLIPAVMLSHKLSIPYTKWPHHDPATCLIVDDIADSGLTLKWWSDFDTAVLHYKPHSSVVMPKFYSEIHKTDDWIIYPWERQDSKTIQDYKLDK